MFSSQASTNSSFRQSGGYSSSQLPHSDSCNYGTSGNTRGESSSMSTSSQEMFSSNLRPQSQGSPSRRLAQLYTSKESLYRGNNSTKNVRENSSFMTGDHVVPFRENTTDSIAILTFLVKDLLEKFGALRNTVDKFADMQTIFLNNLTAEFQSRFEQVGRNFFESIGASESQMIKIAKLEAIVLEKSRTIEKIEAENEVLRSHQHEPSVIALMEQQVPAPVVDQLTKEELEHSLVEMLTKIETSFDEKMIKLQRIFATKVESINKLRPISKRNSPMQSTPPQNFGRTTQNGAGLSASSTTSSVKTPLNFVFDFKHQQPRRLRDVTCPQSLTQSLPRALNTAAPGSAIVPSIDSTLSGSRRRRSFMQPRDQFGAANWKQSNDGTSGDFSIGASRRPKSEVKTTRSDSIFIVGEATASSSGSSPEIIMERLVARGDRKRANNSPPLLDGGSIFQDEDMMTDDMEKMIL